MKKIVFAILLLIMLALSASAAIEEVLPFQFPYDLSRFRIVTIAADQFNYEETVELSGLWRAMGARVDFAGAKRELAGERGGPGDASQPGAQPPLLKVDLLLSEVDARRYDLVYIAGGDGIGKLIEGQGAAIRRLVEQAREANAYVAAICHAPLALTVSGLIKGRRLTANGEGEIRALLAAGATVVDEVFVRDGIFLTGQYPFMRTFALQVAETLQFPGGDGPLQKYLSARPALEKALDGLKNATEVSGREVAAGDLETVLRSAYKTILMQPWGNYPPLFKLARVRDEKTRQAIALGIAGRLKAEYKSRFGSEERIDAIVRKCFLVPPELFIVFIDADAAGPAGSPFRDLAMRAAVARYGAALENISLTAESLGLGVGLLGFPPFLQSAEPTVRRELAVPGSMVLIDMFLIGHPLRSNPPAISRPLSALMLGDAPGPKKEAE